MPCFVVWEICFLILLSGNGDETGRLGSLHGVFNKGGGSSIYDANNFLEMMTWRIRFLGGDTKAEMVSSSWNNFLQPLLCFVMVRSIHGEGLVRINMFQVNDRPWIRFFEISLSSQSVATRGRRKTQEGRRRLFSFQPTGMLVAIL
jgi:hypothetical protein